jgi:hypothetical protein
MPGGARVIRAPHRALWVTPQLRAPEARLKTPGSNGSCSNADRHHFTGDAPQGALRGPVRSTKLPVFVSDKCKKPLMSYCQKRARLCVRAREGIAKTCAFDACVGEVGTQSASGVSPFVRAAVSPRAMPPQSMPSPANVSIARTARAMRGGPRFLPRLKPVELQRGGRG